MHVAPQLSVGTTYKQDAVQPRGVSMIMSSDSAAAVPYGMVPQFSTLQIGSPVMKAILLAIMTMIQHKFFFSLSHKKAVHQPSLSILSAINHSHNANGRFRASEQRRIT